uniref:Olfactomedin-4-like n=1 Tax=Sphaeramia orbicularis TaxID=375764 RepID=A0A672Z0A3_9TELE
MKRSLVLSLFQLFQLFQLITVTQSSADSCVCELINSQKPFPHDRLNTAKDEASRCNRNISLKMSADMDTLLLALDRRLPQIQSELSLLEVEDDRDLYGLLSLVVIENELLEITQILEKLNGSTEGHQRLTANTQQQIMHIKEELKDLQELDTMEVVKRQQANQRLKRDLDQCRNGLRTKAPTTSPPPGLCPYGRFMNVSGPRVFTAGEYPGSFKYGAWGRDPKPDPGKEHWYWMVPMASSNRYAHYVRRYSSLSSLIVGVSTPGNVMIHSSNPTTNTVQGPNVVMYGEALYYNATTGTLSAASTSPPKPSATCSYPEEPGLTTRRTTVTWRNVTRSPTWTWPQTSPASGSSTPPTTTSVTWFCPRSRRATR